MPPRRQGCDRSRSPAAPRLERRDYGRPLESYPCRTSGRIEVRGSCDGHPGRVGAHDDDVVTDDDQQQRREARAEHDAGIAAPDVVGQGQCGRRADADGADRLPGGEPGQEICSEIGGRRGIEGCGCPHGGQERTGRDHPPELMGEHRALRQRVARSTVLLRQVEAEPPEVRERLPDRGEHLIALELRGAESNVSWSSRNVRATAASARWSSVIAIATGILRCRFVDAQCLRRVSTDSPRSAAEEGTATIRT